MKKVISTIIVSLLFLNVSSQCQDSIACKKVEDTLTIIEKFLTDRNSDHNLHIVSSVYFLLEISGIPYKGKVSYFGPDSPSKDFFLECKEWYVINRKKLRWNNKQKKVFVATE